MATPSGQSSTATLESSPQTEKRFVLDCLAREAKRNPWFVITIQMDSRLGDLVFPGMETVVKENLTDPARDGARQSFVLILIESLRHGQALPGLTDLMMEIVREAKWWSDVRRAALDALIQKRGDEECATAELKALLTGVRVGSVSDPDDDLLGSLLRELYPGRLPASKLWQYLKTPQNPFLSGMYCYFWNWHIPEKSTNVQLAELLDGLVEQFEQLRSCVRRLPSTDRIAPYSANQAVKAFSRNFVREHSYWTASSIGLGLHRIPNFELRGKTLNFS